MVVESVSVSWRLRTYERRPVKKPSEPTNALPLPAEDVDLLADIFSATTTTGTSTTTSTTTATSTPVYDPFNAQPVPMQPTVAIDDLFGVGAPAPTPVVPQVADLFGATPTVTPTPNLAVAPVASSTPTPTSTTEAPPVVIVPAFEKDGLEIEFSCSKNDPLVKQKSELVANFKNNTGAPVYGFNMRCAVPKYVSMELQPPTSTTIPVSGVTGTVPVTQTIRVTNSMMGTKNLMLKLKLSYSSKGKQMEEMATCGGFPAGKF